MNDDRIDTGRSETEQAIMTATLVALAKHGYADLSIKSIGTEFEKSTSLLYYHYENKDELLLAFLDYVIDLFVATIDPNADDPDVELRSFVEHVLPPERPQDGGDVQPVAPPGMSEPEMFQRAIFELRTQTIHDDDYRQKFGEMESYMIDTISTLICREIDAGHYRDMNADVMAENLMAFLFRSLDVRVTGTRPKSANAMRESVYFLLDDVMPSGTDNSDDTASADDDCDA